MADQACRPLCPEPFRFRADDRVLSDLRARLRNTRWPDPSPGTAWSQGTDLGYLRKLVAWWGSGFDWRARERELNQFHHFLAEIDGLRIHFLQEKARHGRGIPLILTHGWPSTFAEFCPLIPLLTDPAAHGIDGPAFDVIIPSLPGHGFSGRPGRAGVTPRYTAGLWHQLMRGLGYERYAAGGGDIGEAVTMFMALDNPGPLIGIHLHTLLGAPYTGPGSAPLSPAEQAYLAQYENWSAREYGYGAIQSTKPQTVGYALNDSPAGLAAWILEKWRAWADTGGDLETRFDRDFLLTTVMLYWLTETITSSVRGYYDKRWLGDQPGPGDFVSVPTAVALFDHQFTVTGSPPREWAERLYNVRRWTPMPSGGGFAPAEEPELVAGNIAGFFAGLDA